MTDRIFYRTPALTDEHLHSLAIFDAYRLGEDLLSSRYPRDAVRALRIVVDAEPHNSGAWELLGRAHFAAAQLGPAEAAFRRLVDLEPSSAWAHTALGLSLDRQGRHSEGEPFHRMAAVMGDDARDATRVTLVDHASVMPGAAA